jgi:hypothetical protein
MEPPQQSLLVGQQPFDQAHQGQPAYPFAAFFGPWEPPPSYAPSPQDPAVLERISLLVMHSLSNGPQFIATVKERQVCDADAW